MGEYCTARTRNQIAGFAEYRPLTHREKIIMSTKWKSKDATVVEPGFDIIYAQINY